MSGESWHTAPSRREVVATCCERGVWTGIRAAAKTHFRVFVSHQKMNEKLVCGLHRRTKTAVYFIKKCILWYVHARCIQIKLNQSVCSADPNFVSAVYKILTKLARIDAPYAYKCPVASLFVVCTPQVGKPWTEGTDRVGLCNILLFTLFTASVSHTPQYHFVFVFT